MSGVSPLVGQELANRAEWISMNLRALEIERAEIRHWQGLVPHIALWFITGIVALAGFLLTRPVETQSYQLLTLGVAICLAITVLTVFFVRIAALLGANASHIHRNGLPIVERALFSIVEDKSVNRARLTFDGSIGSIRDFERRIRAIPGSQADSPD